MDVPRSQRRRWSRRALWIGVAAVSLAAVTLGLGSLRAASPQIAESAVRVERVRRGTFVREVQARGTLVPEVIHWVTATGPANVGAIHVAPGAAVEEGAPLLSLHNAELELAALESERAAAAAAAQLIELEVGARAEQIALRAGIAELEGATEALLARSETTDALASRGLAAKLDQRDLKSRADGAERQLALERQRERHLDGGFGRRRESRKRELDKLAEVAAFRRQQLAALEVRAPTDGVVQELPLEAGQWVTSGTVLAKIAKPGKLKALLDVPEALVSDVTVGQPVRIELFGAHVDGVVARVDPSVQAGVVRVEVRLSGDVPDGARSDVAVTGIIELERVEDALVLARPAGMTSGRASLFKLEPSDNQARRVEVQLGRASVREIEIVAGLSEGDAVVIGDLERFADADTLLLD